MNLRQKSRIDQDSRTAIADFFSLSVGSQGSAFTVGAAAATAAGAVAASTRRKTRASRVGPWDGAGGGRWQAHVAQPFCSQVAARAEVGPGEKVVGIDLGTTNSAVAAMEDAQSESS